MDQKLQLGPPKLGIRLISIIMSRAQQRQAATAQRLRNWCFTINNPEDNLNVVSTHDALHAWGESLFTNCGLRFLVFQLERGASGTPHLQGYLEYPRSMRFAHVRRDLHDRSHLEPRRGTAQEARDYCCKPDGRILGPFEYGQLGHESQGQRTDLEALAGRITEGATRRDLVEEMPAVMAKYHKGAEYLMRYQRAQPQPAEAPEVTLLVGPPGAGKSRYAYDHEDPDDIWTSPVTDGIWCDEYDTHPAVLLDDFDGRMSKYPLKHFLRLLDRYVVNATVKSSFTKWKPKRIYITSNYHPREWYATLSALLRLILLGISGRSVNRSMARSHDGSLKSSRFIPTELDDWSSSPETHFGELTGIPRSSRHRLQRQSALLGARSFIESDLWFLPWVTSDTISSSITLGSSSESDPIASESYEASFVSDDLDTDTSFTLSYSIE